MNQKLNNHRLSPALLDEYGLTDYKYDILCLCIHPTYWKQGGLTHSITTLYHLVDDGLLTGPSRGKPHSVPFQLTAKGRDILARLHRGLHKPSWLSPNKAKCLKTLIKNNGYIIHSPKIHGFSKTTLQSLANAGYVQAITNVQWQITPLGREAWLEYINSKGVNQ